MKIGFRALLIIILVGGGTQISVVPEAEARFRVGNWTGNSFYSRNRFSHCRIWVRYRSGITLNIAQFRSYNLFVGVSRPDWNLVPKGTYNMTLFVDGQFVRSAKGIVLNANRTRLWLALGRDYYVRQRLRRGLRLTLTNGKQRYRFSLTGTSAALARLERCVRFKG